MNNQDNSLEGEIDRILQKAFMDIRKRVVSVVAKHNKKITKDIRKAPVMPHTHVPAPTPTPVPAPVKRKEKERKVRYKKEEEHFSSRSLSESSD